jgi:hypothetical protein
MRWWLLPMVAGCAVGCGVLDRLTTLTFDLPTRTFTVNTQESQWRPPPQGFSSAAIDCATSEDCCMPADEAPLSCMQFPFICATGACAIEFPFEVVAPVDLGDQKELGQARGQIPAELTLSAITYEVRSELNVALPEVAIYVAPADVAMVTDPKAHLLGVVPTTNAGLHASGTIALTPDARQAFGSLARDLKTPFNLIASTRIKIVSGGVTPSGKVDLDVSGKITAKF